MIDYDKLKVIHHKNQVKLKAIHDQSHVIGKFLDWLMRGGLESYGPVELAYRQDYPEGRGGDLKPLNWSIKQILAAYFEIDRAKLGTERRAMLKMVMDLEPFFEAFGLNFEEITAQVQELIDADP